MILVICGAARPVLADENEIYVSASGVLRSATLLRPTALDSKKTAEPAPERALLGGGRLSIEFGFAEQWRVGVVAGAECSEELTRLAGIGGRERWHVFQGDFATTLAWSPEGVFQPIARVKAGLAKQIVYDHVLEKWNERVKSDVGESTWQILVGATAGYYLRFSEFWRLELSADVEYQNGWLFGGFLSVAWSFYL